MGGGCCIGDFPPCCVMDNIIGEKWDEFWCTDCCVGYTPERSDTEAHAKKIAEELKTMKEKRRESAKKAEQKIMNKVQRFMRSFISELEEINGRTFGGEKLNINIDGIREKQAALEEKIVGHIGRYFDDRLVLTDKELSVILQEKDDEKRSAAFEEFCEKVNREAIDSLRNEIKAVVKEQEAVVDEEIKRRLEEVEKQAAEQKSAFEETLAQKQTNSPALEQTRIRHMYRAELHTILLDQLNEKQ